MRRLLFALAAGVMAVGAGSAHAEDTVKLALVQAISNNPLQVYAKQTMTGFYLGLDYATNGTMMVKGKKIVVVEKDTQAKPDIARSMLEEAYSEGALIAIGGTSSGATTAMLPVAAENEKLLVIEGAVADLLTGPNSNRYVFKTSRNSSMDMQAAAVALQPDKNLYLATLAQDYAFGHDGINALKAALKGTGANIVDEEYVPFQTTDFTATIQRMIDALKDKPGRKVIFVNIAGIDAFTPLTQAGLDRFGITLSTGGFILPQLKTIAKKLAGAEGAMYYHYMAPKNAVNDWLVKDARGQIRHPAGLLHLRRHGCGPGHRQGAQDRRQLGHRHPHQDDGGHDLGHAQGADDLPPGGSPGHAGHVHVQDEGGPEPGICGSRAGARDQGQRDEHPDRPPRHQLISRNVATGGCRTGARPRASEETHDDGAFHRDA